MTLQRPAPRVVRARNLDPTVDNKIHDDDVARRFGFAGALVPGVELFAYLTNPLVRAWGPDFLADGAIDVRFRRPVYDGEDVVASAEPAEDGGWRLALVGPEGDARATGSARRQGDGSPADLSGFQDTAPRHPLPPADPTSLAVGPMGSVREPVDAQSHARYLDGIDEDLEVYRDGGVVHPGALLRLVNALLVRNVTLGPWIHTASSCRFLGLARVPTQLVAHGRVTDNYERNGRWWVRYDALVLAGADPVMLVDHTAIYRLEG